MQGRGENIPCSNYSEINILSLCFTINNCKRSIGTRTFKQSPTNAHLEIKLRSKPKSSKIESPVFAPYDYTRKNRTHTYKHTHMCTHTNFCFKRVM